MGQLHFVSITCTTTTTNMKAQLYKIYKIYNYIDQQGSTREREGSPH